MNLSIREFLAALHWYTNSDAAMQAVILEAFDRDMAMGDRSAPLIDTLYAGASLPN